MPTLQGRHQARRERLLPEVDDLIRTMPAAEALRAPRDPAVLAWWGRAQAVVHAWGSPFGAVELGAISTLVHSPSLYGSDTEAGARLLTLLHQARHDLVMWTGSTSSVAVGRGDVFDYYTGLTQQIQLAKEEVFFVDPYINGDFVASYLPQVGSNVAVRLLTEKYIPALLPAVQAFAAQHGTEIEVREASFHDRLLFVDKRLAFMSTASFKDGGRKAPAALVQIVDLFPAVSAQYEAMWKAATVHR